MRGNHEQSPLGDEIRLKLSYSSGDDLECGTGPSESAYVDAHPAAHRVLVTGGECGACAVNLRTPHGQDHLLHPDRQTHLDWEQAQQLRQAWIEGDGDVMLDTCAQYTAVNEHKDGPANNDHIWLLRRVKNACEIAVSSRASAADNGSEEQDMCTFISAMGHSPHSGRDDEYDGNSEVLSVVSNSSSTFPADLNNVFEAERRMFIAKERILETVDTMDSSTEIARDADVTNGGDRDRELLATRLQMLYEDLVFAQEQAHQHRRSCLRRGIDPETFRYRRTSSGLGEHRSMPYESQAGRVEDWLAASGSTLDTATCDPGV